MGLGAFDLNKHTLSTNMTEWLKATDIIAYGVVTEALAENLARVEQVVRSGASRAVHVVPLLSFASSLFETRAEPQVGDLVLLLFADKYTGQMFQSPLERFEATNEWSIYDPNAQGRNKFSGLGILLAPYRGWADTTLQHSRSEGSPVMTFRSAAHISAVLQREVCVMFSALPGDSGEKDRLIHLIFGQHSPELVQRWAAVTEEHGFAKKSDNDLEEVSAPVTQRYSIYAPIVRDIQGTQTTDVGLGADKDGNPVETEASIAEIVHGKAPITRDIRSPQTVVVGIGNAESGDGEEERDAPVTETYGSKAPITKDIRGAQTYKIGVGKDGDTEAPVDIELGSNADVSVTSRSALKLHFDKAVEISAGDSQTLTVEGDLTIEVGGKVKITSSGCVINDVLEVK
jgi:hypothetical protein